jgi:hypothetical protein
MSTTDAQPPKPAVAPPPTRYASVDEIRALVAAFETCEIARGDWTHSAHLATACWYHLMHGAAEALERMRTGIQRFNTCVGVETTPSGGYHETLTRFYVWLVGRELAARRATASVVDRVNAVVAACDDRSIPLGYYSRERLMSPDARYGWVAPDLRPLEET